MNIIEQLEQEQIAKLTEAREKELELLKKMKACASPARTTR